MFVIDGCIYIQVCEIGLNVDRIDMWVINLDQLEIEYLDDFCYYECGVFWIGDMFECFGELSSGMNISLLILVEYWDQLFYVGMVVFQFGIYSMLLWFVYFGGYFMIDWWDIGVDQSIGVSCQNYGCVYFLVDVLSNWGNIFIFLVGILIEIIIMSGMLNLIVGVGDFLFVIMMCGVFGNGVSFN